ncbi:MAG: hypothetical protein QOF28_1970, partial [Actinomycetota bacterium]|nr:hypothetical protein [Actinomycetota bacterium]
RCLGVSRYLLDRAPEWLSKTWSHLLHLRRVFAFVLAGRSRSGVTWRGVRMRV